MTFVIVTAVLLFGRRANAEGDAAPDQSQFEAVSLAIRDLAQTFPDRDTGGQEHLRRLDACERR